MESATRELIGIREALIKSDILPRFGSSLDLRPGKDQLSITFLGSGRTFIIKEQTDA